MNDQLSLPVPATLAAPLPVREDSARPKSGDKPSPEINEDNLHDLSDEALLTIIVGERAAKKLLAEANGSLQNLARMPLPELVHHGKLKPEVARRLHAGLVAGKRGFENPGRNRSHSITSSMDAARVLGPKLAHERNEKFVILTLDVKNRPIGIRTVSNGTVNATLVHPRDVFGAATRDNAHAIMVAHNHPSGDPTPSDEDAALTRRLVAGAEIMGIRLLDHLVIVPDDYYSFADAGRMTR